MYAYFALTLISWIYFRTIVYPLCLLHEATLFIGREEIWDMIKYSYLFEYFLLNVLLIMNIYWVTILSKMFLQSLKKKNLQNSYDPNLLKNKKE